MADVSPCWDREVLLSAYLDGELTAGELDEVVAHLDGCTECLGVFRALKEARTAIRRLPLAEMPAGLAASLHLGDRLSAFLDGELSAGDFELVGSHLEACPDCRIELRDLDAARTAVRSLPRLELLPHDAAAAAATDGASTRTRRLRVAVAVAAVAAVAVVFASGGTAAPAVDRESLANRHSARTSVEQGFAVIPAFATPPGSP